jgi:hypothetical protein
MKAFLYEPGIELAAGATNRPPGYKYITGLPWQCTKFNPGFFVAEINLFVYVLKMSSTSFHARAER